MAWQDWLTVASIVGVVIAIFMGRRRGRQRFQASMAAARAEGHATAKAELAAQLVNVVQVGNTLPGQGDDPVVEALRRVAVESGNVLPGNYGRDNLASGNDSRDNLASGFAGIARRGDRELQQSALWAAGHLNGDGSARGVGDGPAMTWNMCRFCGEQFEHLNESGYCVECSP